jgi:hypothetical protein
MSFPCRELGAGGGGFFFDARTGVLVDDGSRATSSSEEAEISWEVRGVS